jgi:hypothetical protein
MAFTFCSSGAMVRKAGANVDSNAAASGALLLEFSDEVEGYIIAETRKSYVTNFSSLNEGIKNALKDVASDLGAMKLIAYNMANYTSRMEAQTMLDVLRDNANKNIAALKDAKSSDLITP